MVGEERTRTMDTMFDQLIAAAAQPQPSPWVSLMPMVLIFMVFYFIWFRPMAKNQKKLNEMIDALKKGDKVITNGGLYGEVVKVDGGVVLLKLADNVKVRIAKRAIAGPAGSSEDNGGN